MKFKRFKKFMSFALAAALMVLSLAPAGVQTVQAADVNDGNPFNQNVALGKDVTVSVADNGEHVSSLLVNGVKTSETADGEWWESVGGPSNQYPVDIVIDLKEEYLIDRVALYWREVIPANKYKVQVSSDKNTWTTVGQALSAPSDDVTGDHTIEVEYPFDPQNVRYVKVACEEAFAYSVYGLREIEAYTVGGINESKEKAHALNKTAYAPLQSASVAFINDGNEDTRWQTVGTDIVTGENNVLNAGESTYFYIDLGSIETINQVKIKWEGAYASNYTIETATDENAIVGEGITDSTLWTNIATEDVSTYTERTENNFEDTQARFVKVTGTAAGGYGLSIWEVEVNHVKESILPEFIYLSKSKVVIPQVGDTVKLYAQVLPANAEDATVTWSSDNEEVATVADGVVTAVANGNATITAKVNETIMATCAVQVASQLETPVVTATKNTNNTISLSWSKIVNADTFTIYRSTNGGTYEVLDTLLSIPETDVTYGDSTVVAGNTYTYKVEASDSKGEYATSELSIATDAILIPLSITGLNLSTDSLDLVVGGASGSVSVTAEPVNATIASYAWTISDETKAYIYGEKNKSFVEIVPMNAGTVDVSVTVTDDLGNELTETCVVNVKAKLPVPTVKAEKADDNKVTITWNEVTNAVSYDVYRQVGKNGEFTLLTEGVEATGYTDTIDSEEGNTYRYQVVAKAAADSALYLDSDKSKASTSVQIGEVSPFGLNVAEGKTVTTDANILRDLVITNIVDGITDVPDNRFDTSDSGNEDEVTFTIDLGDSYPIETINIHEWDYVYAGNFEIKLSQDDQIYQNATYTKTDSKVNAFKISKIVLDEITSAQYVQITCSGSFSESGADRGVGAYTIGEVEIYTPGVVDENAEPVDTVDSVLISKDAVELEKDQNIQLYAQPLPANTTQTITWSVTEGTDVVTVSETGKVTALKGGVATVTATAGDKSATCEITVMEKLDTPQNISAALSDDKVNIEITWDAVEKADSYRVLRKASDADYSEVTATSNNVFTDTTVEQGTTYSYKVIAENNENEFYVASDESAETEAITVPVRVTGITMDSKLTVEAGKSITINATVNPENATNKEITWSSNAEAVAIVDENGNVTGLKAGRATITARADEKSATCTVIVTQKLETPEATAQMAEDEESITVTWEAITNADNYVVTRKVGNADYEILATTQTLSYVDEDLTKGQTYSYNVKATNNDEEIYPSSNESAKTEEILVPIHVESVSLSETEAEVLVDETITLEATINPDNASNQNVIWESDAQEVATVDQNGTVTGVGIGTATISVTTEDGDKTDTCTVTVLKTLDTPVVTAQLKEYDPTITISSNSIPDTYILLSWDDIENAKDYTIYRSVNGEESVSVNKVSDTEYVDTNLEEGNTYSYTVVANPANEYYVASESNTTEAILVPIHVDEVALNKTTAELKVGEELTLTVTITPDDATNMDVSWSSSKPEVATVTSGVVKALSVGETTITVTTEDGNKTATCVVTVKAATVPGGNQGGSQTPGGNQGGTQTPGGNTGNNNQGGSQQHTHTWSEVKVIKDATTTATGLKGKVCTVCGEEDRASQVVMPKYTVTLNAKSAPLQVKKSTKAIKATVVEGDKIVKWESSNKKIATVNNKGVIKAKNKTGKVKITAISEKGAKATVTIKVQKKKVKTTKVAVTNVSKKRLQLAKGESFTLDTKLTPVTSPESIKYSTSKKSVAKVSKKGVITAKKKGTAKITVKSGSKKVVIKVTVK